MRIALALLLLVGCGTGRRTADFEPMGGCKDGIWTEDDSRDCECLRKQLSYSKDLLKDRLGIEASWFEGLSVYVSAKARHIEKGSNVMGATWNDEELVTERYMRAVPHELLHVYELRNSVSKFDTAEHKGWKERGWISLGNEGWITIGEDELCR